MGTDTRSLAAADQSPTADSSLLFTSLGGFYSAIEPLTYALLRFGYGAILLTHGWPKLTGTGHGTMSNALATVTGRVENQLHLPFPWLFGGFIAFLETGGAAMLTLGLLTRIVAPMIAIEMAVICYVLAPSWIWSQGGIEYPLLMGLLAFHISLRGGGCYSLDRLFGREV